MNFRHRIETALADHIGAVTNMATVCGQSAESKPDAVCVAFVDGARPQSVTLAAYGNFDADVKVIVRTNANDETAAQHADRVELIQQAMRDITNIAAQMLINSVHAYDVRAENMDEGQDSDRFVTTLAYTIPCVDIPIS